MPSTIPFLSLAIWVPIAFGILVLAVGRDDRAEQTRVLALVGALISLQKLRVSPDAAFSVNDWTAFVIFIVVIGGIGTIEGPIIGTIVFFLLREFLADFGTLYLLFLGTLAIVVMLAAPKGLWGYAAERFGWSLFPVGYRITFKD